MNLTYHFEHLAGSTFEARSDDPALALIELGAFLKDHEGTRVRTPGPGDVLTVEFPDDGAQDG